MDWALKIQCHAGRVRVKIVAIFVIVVVVVVVVVVVAVVAVGVVAVVGGVMKIRIEVVTAASHLPAQCHVGGPDLWFRAHDLAWQMVRVHPKVVAKTMLREAPCKVHPTHCHLYSSIVTRPPLGLTGNWAADESPG